MKRRSTSRRSSLRCFLSLGTAGTARAATIDADIMFVMDGSGSMGDDFTALGVAMSVFVNALQADQRMGNVRVGLVRYSLNAILQVNMTDDLTAFDGLSRGKGNFSTENPLMAIDFAVTNPAVVYRPDAVKTVVLITDEEGNDFKTYENAYGTGVSALNFLLDDLGFLNNIIHNPRKRGSTENYIQIARPYGALFDIADFRDDPLSFMSRLRGDQGAGVRGRPGAGGSDAERRAASGGRLAPAGRRRRAWRRAPPVGGTRHRRLSRKTPPPRG